MAFWTPFLHCPLISLGTTLICLTLRGVAPFPRIAHVDLQLLPSCPRQHWGCSPPSMHEDTQQHSHMPGLLFASPGQPPSCSWWALQHFTRLRFSTPHSRIILCAVLLLPGLRPALAQRRPWPEKPSGHIKLSCHNPEPGHLWKVCTASLAVGNYIEKKIRISSNWNSDFIYFLSSKLYFQSLHPRVANIHLQKNKVKKNS